MSKKKEVHKEVRRFSRNKIMYTGRTGCCKWLLYHSKCDRKPLEVLACRTYMHVFACLFLVRDFALITVSSFVKSICQHVEARVFQGDPVEGWIRWAG